MRWNRTKTLCSRCRSRSRSRFVVRPRRSVIGRRFTSTGVNSPTDERRADAFPCVTTPDHASPANQPAPFDFFVHAIWRAWSTLATRRTSRVESTRCKPGERSEGRENRFRANRSAERLSAETGSRNGRCGTRVRAIQLSGRPARADRGRGYHKSRLTVGKIFAAQPVASLDFSRLRISACRSVASPSVSHGTHAWLCSATRHWRKTREKGRAEEERKEAELKESYRAINVDALTG